MQTETKNESWKIKHKDGQAVCLCFSDVSGYLEQVGENTEVENQPEEILAENFALLVIGKEDVPSPKIIKDMKKYLSFSDKEKLCGIVNRAYGMCIYKKGGEIYE